MNEVKRKRYIAILMKQDYAFFICLPLALTESLERDRLVKILYFKKYEDLRMCVHANVSVPTNSYF